MLNQPYSVRSISNAEEAKRIRVLVFDQEFKMRPLLVGESLGDVPSQRSFQEVYPGDYIVVTTMVEHSRIPLVKVSRHKEKLMSGTYGTEVLNRIHPILSRYLMDYNLAPKRA